MNVLWIVMIKELTDLFRDRRTLAVALLMGPLLMPILMLGIGKLVSNRMITQIEKPFELPVIGAEHAPNFTTWLQSQNVIIKPAPNDPDAAILEQQEDVILRIDPHFGKSWRTGQPASVEIMHDSSRQSAEIPVKRLESLLTSYSQTVGALRLVARGISPTVNQPLRVGHRDLATPESQLGRILAFLPYFLILGAFIGSAYLVIDITAGERERQSLEPLLATPARREMIMSGKIAAACIFGVLSLMITLAMFKLSFQFMPAIGIKIDVSIWVITQILFVLSPVVLMSACLLTLISAASKSVKEAQSYMSILMLIPMIPSMILMVNPVKNQLWMLTIPFLSQNQVMLKLVREESISSQEWAVYLFTSFGISFLLWWLAARRYHDERLAISA